MDERIRIFDRALHEEFARISCDTNPIHMDPVVARRTAAGAPIVHGIHSLLWMLESLCESGLPVRPVGTLKAQFTRPAYVGDEVRLSVAQSAPRVIRATLLSGVDELVRLTLALDETSATTPLERDPNAWRIELPERPHERALASVQQLKGVLPFATTADVAAFFPSAVRALGVQRVAALVSTSCLVGMVVPGLHSMFSGLDISWSPDDTASANSLYFAVASVDTRFRIVRIGVTGPGLHGTLNTIMRMPPTQQPSIQQVQPLVARDQFRDSTTLVVGGSRGLGELAAKLSAAGGSRVIVTYAAGKGDAERVADEINASGATCSVMHYDIHEPALEQLQALSAVPTHVYYFATPPIGSRKSGLFDAARFAELNRFYLDAFNDLVRSCVHMNPAGVRAFYPSSTYVESRPAGMTEYAMAKAAAELLCQDLQRFTPSLEVLVRRLPRMLTDQTNSAVPLKAADSVEVLLSVVREMHS